jgi:DNA mismatch endonuclease (patch repair protein)
MMSRVKARDNKAELMLRKELWGRGIRYRLHSKHLIGKPDLIFARKAIAVFVDGDFWHGRALIEEGVEGLKRGLRTARSDWWIEKIQKTAQRDQTVTRRLEADGWTVIRFWESDVLQNCTMAADIVQSLLGSLA